MKHFGECDNLGNRPTNLDRREVRKEGRSKKVDLRCCEHQYYVIIRPIPANFVYLLRGRFSAKAPRLIKLSLESLRELVESERSRPPSGSFMSWPIALLSFSAKNLIISSTMSGESHSGSEQAETVL